VLGTLPHYLTGTGLRHAGGGLLQPPFEVAADPGEVAAIFEVPLAFLMDGANHQRLSVDLPGGGAASTPCRTRAITSGARRPACCAICSISCARSHTTLS
jgi:hypothetical protein